MKTFLITLSRQSHSEDTGEKLWRSVWIRGKQGQHRLSFKPPFHPHFPKKNKPLETACWRLTDTVPLLAFRDWDKTAQQTPRRKQGLFASRLEGSTNLVKAPLDGIHTGEPSWSLHGDQETKRKQARLRLPMSPLRVLRSQSLHTNFLQLGSHFLKGPSIDSMSLPEWARGITWIQSTAEAGSLFQFQHSEWNRVGNCESLSVRAACLCWCADGTGVKPSIPLFLYRALKHPPAMPRPWGRLSKYLGLLQGSCFTPLCFQFARSLPLRCYHAGNWHFLNQFLPLLLLDWKRDFQAFRRFLSK